MKKMDFKKVIGWLGVMLRCPVCNVKYNLESIKIIESTQDEQTEDARLLIHSDCEKCKSSVMFNIDIEGPEVVSVGMITDLTSKDTTKFSKYSPISANDCIAIHKSLKGFNGDFVKALN